MHSFENCCGQAEATLHLVNSDRAWPKLTHWRSRDANTKKANLYFYIQKAAEVLAASSSKDASSLYKTAEVFFLVLQMWDKGEKTLTSFKYNPALKTNYYFNF